MTSLASETKTSTCPNAEVGYDMVVSLGTDYHHFDRLVNWVEAFLESHPEVTCLFQHGFTRQPKGAEAVERMPREELLAHYGRAKVVLVQGGPGSILDAREMGVIPFAVPRLKKFDEVVDDHQVQFSEIMESHGEAVVIKNKADLFDKLSKALANPDSVKAEKRVSECDTAALNLGEAMAGFQNTVKVHRPSRFVRRCGQVAKTLLSK